MKIVTHPLPILVILWASFLGFFTFQPECEAQLQVLPKSSAKDSKLNANNDHGFWLLTEANTKINDRLTVFVNIDQRWGANYQLLWYQRLEAIMRWDVTDLVKKSFTDGSSSLLSAISVGAGCAEILEIRRNTKGKHEWALVSRPEAEVNLNLEKSNWLLRQRLRLEYVNFVTPHYKSHATCRYRFALSPPWSFTSCKIRPYVSNEFFVRANTYSKTSPNGLVGGVYQNRLRIGFSAITWHDVLSSEIYWQWRVIKRTPGSNPRWNNTYQWGMALMFAF